MRKFIIKAAKHGKNDPFGFKEATEFLYFYAEGLTDLRKTMRCITPKGFRVHKERWWADRVGSDELILNNPLLRTEMFRIKEIEEKQIPEHTLEYTNSFKYTHTLKNVSESVWVRLNNSIPQ